MSLAFIMMLGLVQWLAGWNWSEAIARYKILRSVDFSQANIDGTIALKERGQYESLIIGLNNSCAAIWKSRFLARYSDAMAKTALLEVEGCRRDELYHVWQGNLAWLRGEREEAIREWGKLKRYEILTLGRSNLLAGNPERAAALYEILLRRNELGNHKVDQMAFFDGLAFAHQQMGNWERAAQYYRIVWELDDRSYAYSYLLGNAYRNSGKCGEAIPVFESGLSHQRQQSNPEQEFFYHAFLGECYAATGNYNLASKNYGLAQDVLEIRERELSKEFIISQGKWLNSLQEAIK